ncbi:MAG: PrsW family glutamic-type intramembrane protease [Candidatus Dormibacteraceae bacterium]
MSDQRTAQPAATDPAAPARVECHSCGRQVPQGTFCGVCGARLGEPSRSGVVRRDAFAAHPNERVVALWLVSALLPHLPHRRQPAFRLALALVVVLLALFGLLGLNAPAIAFAAAAVPFLYFIYLWEVEVYEDRPLRVAGLLLLGGIVLGALWAHFTGHLVTSALIQQVVTGVQASTVLEYGVLIAIGQQIVMLVPAVAVLLLFRHRFDEALDGFTFGAAGALGFAFASTLVDLAPLAQTGQISIVDPLVNLAQVVQRGFLVPVIDATTTGLIAAAIWLLRGSRRPAVAHLTTSLPVAASMAVVAQILVPLVGTLTSRVWIQGLVSLAVTLALIVVVRIALHHLLLAEAAQVGVEGPPFTCPHCRHLVPRLAFCPNCGVAVRATSKRGPGRTGRQVR